METRSVSSGKLQILINFLPYRQPAALSVWKGSDRYRPSAEALRRRIFRDLPLYNRYAGRYNQPLSIQSGYSIAVSMRKIEGNLVLGVGKEENFIWNWSWRTEYRRTSGLSRQRGGVGTPTSDEYRTNIDLYTNNLLIIINVYSEKTGLQEAVVYGVSLLRQYVSVTNLEMELVSTENRVKIML